MSLKAGAARVDITTAALKHSGYETRPGKGSKLSPGDLDLIVDQAAGVLRELYHP